MYKRKGWKLPVIIVCVVLLLLLALVVTGALLVHKVDTIYPGAVSYTHLHKNSSVLRQSVPS